MSSVLSFLSLFLSLTRSCSNRNLLPSLGVLEYSAMCVVASVSQLLVLLPTVAVL